MKKWIAWWVVVSLGASGVVQAQDVSSKHPQPVVTCQWWEAMVTWDSWQAMSEEQRQVACARERNAQAVQAAKVAAQKRNTRYQVVGGLGLAIAIAGVITAFPSGDTVEVLGTAYCVNTDTSYGQNASVDYGACSKGDTAQKVGGLMLASGVTMLVIGWHGVQPVEVSPMIGPHVKGAKATIRWGGK